METLKHGKFYKDWITLEERKQHKNYKVIELTETDESREHIGESLKKVIIKYYIVQDVFKFHKSQSNGRFNSLEFYLSKIIPNKETTRKGEFGEIFGTEFLKQKYDYHFPVNKLSKKDNKDVPVHGEDILGFKYENGEISCLCICESKAAKQYKTKVLNKACKQLKESNIDPKSLIKIHEELWDSDRDLSLKIFKVMREDMLTIEKDNWIFYILENRSIGVFKEHDCLNSLENLKLVYFHLNDLTEFVDNLYNSCGDIFND